VTLEEGARLLFGLFFSVLLFGSGSFAGFFFRFFTLRILELPRVTWKLKIRKKKERKVCIIVITSGWVIAGIKTSFVKGSLKMIYCCYLNKGENVKYIFLNNLNGRMMLTILELRTDPRSGA